jgi:Gpi18-like mannosyltransferase
MIFRCFGKDEVSLKSFVVSLDRAPHLQGEHFTKKDGVRAITWGFAALCFAYIVSLIYCGIFKNEISLDAFIRSWKQYDSYHYLGIAEHGYAGYTEGGEHYFVVFFPLYPWLIRLLHLLVPNYALCGLIISALSYVAACYVFTRLVIERFGHKIGWDALAFLSAYPFAFFFSSLHTESLFLLLSVSCFYFIEKRRYCLVGLFGMLAALTRMQGLFLALIALMQYCITEHPIEKIKARDWFGVVRDLFSKLLPVALIGVSALIYLYINYRVTGNALSFMIFQKQRWNQGFMPFTQALQNLWLVTLNPTEVFYSFTTWGAEIVIYFFCIVILIYGVRRLPPIWTFYFLFFFFLNISFSFFLSFC